MNGECNCDLKMRLHTHRINSLDISLFLETCSIISKHFDHSSINIKPESGRPSDPIDMSINYCVVMRFHVHFNFSRRLRVCCVRACLYVCVCVGRRNQQSH